MAARIEVEPRALAESAIKLLVEDALGANDRIAGIVADHDRQPRQSQIAVRHGDFERRNGLGELLSRPRGA
jgi:hypothetical protein